VSVSECAWLLSVFGSNGVYMGDGTVAIGMDDSYESCLGAIGVLSVVCEWCRPT